MPTFMVCLILCVLTFSGEGPRITIATFTIDAVGEELHDKRFREVQIKREHFCSEAYDPPFCFMSENALMTSGGKCVRAIFLDLWYLTPTGEYNWIRY